MVTIRNAVAADIDAVLAFWLGATTGPSTTDDVDSVGNLLGYDAEALLLAFDDEALVGTVIAGWDGWRATMYRLAVAASHRRRGIASRLVREGEVRLRNSGARRVHLIVDSAQSSASAFWESVGYAPTDQLRLVKTFA